MYFGNSADLVKKLRKDMNLSQEEMANRLYITQKKLSRLENGEVKIDIWEFSEMMTTLGYPSADFWLLYLDTDEYNAYEIYRKLKSLVAAGTSKHNDEIKELLEKLKATEFSKRKFIEQFIVYLECSLDETIKSDKKIRKNADKNKFLNH